MTKSILFAAAALMLALTTNSSFGGEFYTGYRGTAAPAYRSNVSYNQPARGTYSSQPDYRYQTHQTSYGQQPILPGGCVGGSCATGNCAGGVCGVNGACNCNGTCNCDCCQNGVCSPNCNCDCPCCNTSAGYTAAGYNNSCPGGVCPPQPYNAGGYAPTQNTRSMGTHTNYFTKYLRR